MTQAVPWLPLLTTCAGSFAVGILGGILGIGGGVLLVPFLIFATGAKPVAAVGISLFCVIGTSLTAAARSLGDGSANVPLALAIEPTMVVASSGAAFFSHRLGDRYLLLAFAGVVAFVGVLFAVRGRLGGDDDAVRPTGPPKPFDGVGVRPDGSTFFYRPVNVAPLCCLTFGTGAASGLFGIGGGALNVPWMVAVSKLPMRSAAATSALTMSMTGVAGAAVHLSHGTVPLGLVAASLLGVFPGGRIGARLRGRLPVDVMRYLLVAICFIVAASMAHRAVGTST